MAARTKKAASAAKVQDAPTPEPAAAQQPAAAKPATPEARPLFTGPDGKTVQGRMAVWQVIERHDHTAGELAGLPRLVALTGLYPTGSHTGATKAARDAGLLADGADAVTMNARFVSAVDVPREQPEPKQPAAAGQKDGE